MRTTRRSKIDKYIEINLQTQTRIERNTDKDTQKNTHEKDLLERVCVGGFGLEVVHGKAPFAQCWQQVADGSMDAVPVRLSVLLATRK